MDTLRFEAPWALSLLALVPLLALIAWPRRGTGDTVRVGSVAVASGARRTWRVRLEPALLALRLLGIAALIFALARPQRGEASTVVEGQGIDIVLAYDVSSSMTQPFSGRQTRLQAAEKVLTGFIEARKNDRVGLVAFQGSSITLSPLTTDYDALAASARIAGTLQLVDGTAIGTALAASINVLRGSGAASRVVILLTDGENNAGEIQPLAAARIAERLGVRVYTVGIVDRNFPSTRSDVNVDEEALRKIAETTGGNYSPAEDPQGLVDTFGRIEQLEKTRVEGRTFTRFDEWAPYLLAAAVAAFALEIALRTTLFRRLA